VCSVDKCGKRGGEQRNGFFREGVADSGFTIVEAGNEPCQDKHHDSGELEKLLNVVGEMLIAI
jgi:hypothetical protein